MLIGYLIHLSCSIKAQNLTLKSSIPKSFRDYFSFGVFLNKCVLLVPEGYAKEMALREETVKRHGVRSTYLAVGAAGAFEASPLEKKKKKLK